MTLEQVLADTLDRLAHGVGHRAGPWRTPALSTRAPDGAPRARTVVLRDLDRDGMRVQIHTDRRSAKIADLAAEARVGLTVWDAGAGIQAVFAGTAAVHDGDDPVADAAWGALHPSGRRPYALPDAPGTGVDAPPGTPMDEVSGRANLAVIVVHLESLERLDLDPAGNRRARFTLGTAAPRATWLVP